MWELMKFRNLKERDCATVVERCRALLGCAVTLDSATVRKDDVTSVKSRTTIHNAAFSACQIPAFIRETVGSAFPVGYKSASLVRVSSQPVRSELSALVEKTASVNRRFTWNIWRVRLLQFVRRHPLLGDD
jgi:hypothetical protein